MTLASTFRAGFVCLVLAVSAPLASVAQQLGIPNSAILTIDPDQLFSQSAFGLRVAAELEAESAVLTAENRRIEAELSTEEQALTDRRSTMDPDAFRALAQGFDQKVRSNRQAQAAKARTLTKNAEMARAEFRKAVLPILNTMMRESGASVILDGPTVFLSASQIDITDQAIARINAVLGDGSTFRDE